MDWVNPPQLFVLLPDEGIIEAIGFNFCCSVLICCNRSLVNGSFALSSKCLKLISSSSGTYGRQLADWRVVFQNIPKHSPCKHKPPVQRDREYPGPFQGFVTLIRGSIMSDWRRPAMPAG